MSFELKRILFHISPLYDTGTHPVSVILNLHGEVRPFIIAQHLYRFYDKSIDVNSTLQFISLFKAVVEVLHYPTYFQTIHTRFEDYTFLGKLDNIIDNVGTPMLDIYPNDVIPFKYMCVDNQASLLDYESIFSEKTFNFNLAHAVVDRYCVVNNSHKFTNDERHQMVQFVIKQAEQYDSFNYHGIYASKYQVTRSDQIDSHLPSIVRIENRYE